MTRPILTATLALALGAPAFAAEAGGTLSFSTEDGVKASGFGEWNRKYTPENNTLELGLFVGGLFVSKDHNFEDERAGHEEIDPGVSLGGRLGYFPLKFVGAEIEAGVTPTSYDSGRVNLWAFRGMAVGQLPWWRITPFVTVGLGRYFIESEHSGSDSDPATVLGLGAKARITRDFGARIDLRDNIGQKTGDEDGITSNFEILLSAYYTPHLGGAAPAPVVEGDRDRDGYRDQDDACPDQAGTGPDGCPDPDGDGIKGAADQCPCEAGAAPIGCPDRDGDGVLDRDDRCVSQPGPAPHGCPDRDGDGVLDADDKCPDAAGLLPHGCPDRDGDGILDAADKCPDQPETRNGYEDADGCPDEIPEAVKKVTGVMEGIEFDTGKATIRKRSSGDIDKSAVVLKEQASLRMRIHGHTDNVGKDEENQKLSQDRAESVKAYLVGKGIDASRVEAVGHGPSQPRDKNDNDKGRQRNRRIEFELIQ